MSTHARIAFPKRSGEALIQTKARPGKGRPASGKTPTPSKPPTELDMKLAGVWREWASKLGPRTWLQMNGNVRAPKLLPVRECAPGLVSRGLLKRPVVDRGEAWCRNGDGGPKSLP
jgi:hypothetical protein